jgi:SET domain-containing protein 6
MVEGEESVGDLKLRQFTQMIVAREDIKEDDNLFTIPKSAILSVENSALYREYPHLVGLIEDPWMVAICVHYRSCD